MMGGLKWEYISMKEPFCSPKEPYLYRRQHLEVGQHHSPKFHTEGACTLCTEKNVPSEYQGDSSLSKIDHTNISKLNSNYLNLG